MVRKIVIENFMSHTLSVIEPCETLTVLTGPNNCGKSAVVAALQVLCRDEKGSYMLRHGQREATVLIETDDGHSVKWSRSKSNVVTYSIDGRDVHRGAPDDLHDVLLLPTVSMKDGKDEFDIHFGEQKRPIFLLNDSGSHAATFFASSSDAEYIVRMQALHKQRTTEAKSNEKRITEEIRGLDGRIETLRPALALSDLVTQEENRHEELLQDAVKIGALDKANSELRAAGVSNNGAQDSLRPFLNLKEPPQLRDTAAFGSCLFDLRTAQNNLVNFRHTQKLLVSAKAPPEFLDSVGLGQVVSALQRAKEEHEISKRSHEIVTKLSSPPNQEPDSILNELLDELHQANVDVAISKGHLLATKKLAQPPTLREIEGLAGSIETLSQAADKFKEVQELSQVLSTIPTLPNYGDEMALSGIVQDLRDAITTREASTAIVWNLSNLNQVPDQFDVEAMSTVIDDLKAAKKETDQTRASVSECESNRQQAKSRIIQILELNPLCPTCGQNVDGEALVRELETRLA